MPISGSEFLWGFVHPGLLVVLVGVVVSLSGVVSRWPNCARAGAAFVLGVAFLLGWQGILFGSQGVTTKLEWNTERFGTHWIPYAAVLAVLISVLDVFIPGKIGRAIQALLFIAFLPVAAWFLVPDYRPHEEIRTWIIIGFSLALGVTWCAIDFASRKQVGPFPVLLGPVLIGAVAAATIALLPLLSAAKMCGVLVAVMTGAALFARKNQEAFARPAAALFAVVFCGLLYSAYAGIPGSFAGENFRRDLAATLAAVSPWLFFLFGWGKNEDGRLTWSRGGLVTVLCLVPAIAGLALSYLQGQ